MVEAAVAVTGLDLLQLGAEVVVVAIKEPLLLYEVDEHHAVEHQGGIPVAVALGGDAVDEFTEGGKLGLESFVEALGDLLNVHCRPDSGSDKGDVQRRLFIQRDEERQNALEQMVTASPSSVRVLAAGGRLAGLSPDPLPDLRLAARVGEDDEVLEGALGDLALDLAPDRVLRDVVVDAGVALVDGEPCLLRDRLDGVVPFVDPDHELLRDVVIPAQALHEETRKVESLKVWP